MLYCDAKSDATNAVASIDLGVILGFDYFNLCFMRSTCRKPQRACRGVVNWAWRAPHEDDSAGGEPSMRGVPCDINNAALLAQRRAGKTYEDIALLNGVSYGTAWNAVRKARADEQAAAARTREPHKPKFDLVPMYPINFSPAAPCPHRGPIRRGSKLYCEQCGQSGMDHHPDLHRSILTDPRPERKPPAKPLTKPRKQARKPKSCAA